MKDRTTWVTRRLPFLLLLALAAAAQAEDYTYATNSGTITITGYIGPGGAVAIPDTLNGLPVTSIGTNAFYSCGSLTNVTMGNSVTNIGYGAFGFCTNLARVTIGNGVISIGDVAFRMCTNLVSVTMGNGVTIIGNSTFYQCTSLPGITIPDSVTSIGPGAFACCESLASVMIPNSVTSVGHDVFYGCISVTNATIGTNVISIGSRMFYQCTSLASVTIGNGVAGIGDYAFFGCTSLTNMVIPDSVVSLGGDVFEGCASLSCVTIGNGVPEIGYAAFAACSNLVSITLGTNVSSIGSLAFQSCHRLTAVTLPARVSSIGYAAFYDCASLGDIILPDSLLSVGFGAFYRCTGLTSVTLPPGVLSIGNSAFEDCTSLAGVAIPDSVTSVGDYAFAHCSNLVSVTIGTSVATLGHYAFYQCGRLANVAIPNSVTSIGDWAFEACSSLTRVTIPDSVTFLGRNVFAYCTSLAGATIGNGVASIGYYAFFGCTSLADVTIGHGVATIGYAAFDGCSSLTLVTIPDSVSSLGNYAFAHCASLTRAMIGDGVTSVGTYAFYECSSLTGVYFPGNAPGADTTTFSNANSATVFCLQGATGWPAVPGPWADRPLALWYAVTDCSEASLDAALAVNNGEVMFACDGTVELATGKVISSSVTLDAIGRSITLSGGGGVRVFTVGPGVHLTLRNLTIANGNSATLGGGIHNNGGVVAAIDCTFSNNTAVGVTNGGNSFGGAIYNDSGSLLLTNCTFANNRAIGGAGSTGVAGSGPGVAGGTGGNGGYGYGGGICNNSGLVVMANCTFSSNNAVGGAGGFGGRGGDGYTYWNGSYWQVVPGGYGGRGGNGGNAYGGSLNNLTGTITALNVTMARGSALAGSYGLPGNPGAYASGNYGPGSWGWGYGGNTSGRLALNNTILAYGSPTNCWGSVVDNGFNISSDASANLQIFSWNNTDPLLAGGLADNGGPTPTIALLSASPAIDAGNDLVAPTTDQRHMRRAGRSDIGAYEFEMPLIAILGTNGATVANGGAATGQKGTDFGPIKVGMDSPAHTFSITNRGNVTLNISGWTTGGVSSSRFQVSSLPTTIAGGGVSNFNVTFSPDAVGTFDAFLLIANDVTNYTVNLRGSGYLLSTNVGPYAGGNTVTITNGHFGTITNVLVDGLGATIQDSGENWVTLTMPATGSMGVKDIVIQTDTGDITLAGAYTVNPAGEIGAQNWLRWEEVAGLPAARAYVAAGVLNGALYAVGGHNGNSQTNVYRYDGATWMEVAGLPVVRHGMAVGVLNGALHAVGGEVSSVSKTNAYRYDGTTWVEVAGLPAVRSYHAAAVLNDALYAVGGYNGSTYVTNVYRYNGTNWTEVPGLPAARGFLAGAVLNGALYAVGGYDGTSVRDNVYRYNGTNWTEVAALPVACIGGAAAVLNGALYAIGGSAKTNVYRYDGAQWTEVAGLPAARGFLAAGVLNDALYAIGGHDVNAKTNVYRYLAVGSGVSPASGSWTGGYPVVITGTNLCDGGDITNVTLCGVAATILPGQSATQVVVTAGVADAVGLGDVHVFSTSFGETMRSNVFTYLRDNQAPLVFLPANPQVYLTTNALGVSGGSGTGTVSYTVLSGPGVIVGGNQLTVTNGSGTISVRATKAQDDLYYAASVTSSVVAAKADQTITFAPIAPQKHSASIGLAATADSGLAVTFSANPPGSVSGATNLTFSGPGDVEVVASQVGDSNYSTAPDVTNIVRVFSLTTEVGPFAGGNTITITNGNFGVVTNVLVGGINATIQNTGANWVTITVPTMGLPGTQDLIIQTADNGDITLAAAYFFNPMGEIGCWDWSRWVNVAGLPVALLRHAVVELNGAVYAIGGYSGSDARANVYRYNGTNWTEVAPLPAARHGLAAGVLNGALYAIGGVGGGSVKTNAYRYNGTNWTEVAGLPVGRTYLSAGALNGSLYAVGGYDSSWKDSTNVYRFNGTNWTEVAGLPAARCVLAAGVLYGSLCAVGGYDIIGLASTNVYRFNGTNWTEVAGLPAARAYLSVGVRNGDLYAVGGYDGIVRSNVYRYSVGRWAEVAGLPVTLHYHASTVMNGALYAVGGESGGSAQKTNVYRYPASTSSGVSPIGGVMTGGYAVVICGSNLGYGSDITNVTLCGVEATVLPGQSATQVVVKAGSSSTYRSGDVRVYSVSFGETVRSNAFTYLRESQAPLVFSPASPQVYGTTNTLSVSGGSGTGAVSYAVLSGPGLIVDGYELTATNGTGTISIRATKAQDDLFDEASATSSVVAARADQTITFEPIAPQRQHATVGLHATADSGLTVTFAVGAGPGLISGDTNLTFIGEGGVEVVASQAGDSNYHAASDVTNTVSVLALFDLTIQSVHGTATPATGTHTYAKGAVITNTVANPGASGTTQFICSGWTMAGNSPTSGTTRTVVMTITNDATLTWLWTTYYWLNTEAGPYGSVNIGDGWQKSGTSVLITPSAAPYYHFANWTGDAAGDDNPLDLAMDAPKSVTANFAPNMTAGSPEPVPEWWLAQYGLTNFEEDVNTDPDQDGQFTWEEYLAAMTDPTNPASFFHTQVGQGSLLISWPSASGRLYNVETTLNVPGYDWTLTEWTNQPGTPPMNTVTNPPGAMTNALQFFRTRARME